MLVNFVFLAHAAVALVAAFALLLFTEPVSLLLVPGLVWPGAGPLQDVIRAYAALAAVGLILVGLIASVARISGYSTVRWAILISLVLIGLVFVLVSFLLAPEPLKQAVLWINLIFVALYVWVWFFQSETV